MKKYVWKLVALLPLILAACAPTAMSTAETIPEVIPPTQAAVSPVLNYHPLDMKTQIEEVDLVLQAVASGEAQEMRNLFGFTKIACKTVNALGGPPPCQEGEAEGSIVEVLPFLGSEGSYLRKDDINNFPGLNVIGLYAIYKVSDTAYSEANYPAGKYGIMFISPDNLPGVILQVKAGRIIRIDYVFESSSFNTILQRDASMLILKPDSN